MQQSDQTEVQASIHVSTPRRIVAFCVSLVLGCLVIYIALRQPPAPVFLVFMLAFGLAALWLAEKIRRAPFCTIELTETELRDTNGTSIARLDEIKNIDRGVLAIKPSNGFTLILKNTKPRAWAPGLWWRLGRRVGVGGITSAGQTKFMAEQIALRLSEDNQ
ncbi:hypothetical protein [Loktanella sp. S4079]|uniref:hypothetical protein n=1 Tax=Loktanella sp. S4079 TaxID=579483 RepID=UPI0006981F8F|nr:hypothetical protein [Loktanella sp. S4079]